MNRSLGIILVCVIGVGMLVAYSVVSKRNGPSAPAAAGAPGTLQESHLSFQEARDKAAADGKFLVVDAMATWCGPCKMMDRNTWSDGRVASWINERAIFVKLDVDKDQASARELRIEAMPTVILFKDGKELKRSV